MYKEERIFYFTKIQEIYIINVFGETTFASSNKTCEDVNF